MNLQGSFESGGQLNTCLINLAHISSSPHDCSTGPWAAVLRRLAEVEGGGAPGPGKRLKMMGVEQGLANGQPGTLKRVSQLVVGDQDTERLMVVVSPPWLTVRGMVAADDDGNGGEMWGYLKWVY